ncbi:MAG: ABC transporter permease [Puniceicoccales bacterium]|nr:ABC transporter permease [Puniceicoccales bacterium]
MDNKDVVWYKKKGVPKLLAGAVIVGLIVLIVLLSIVWTPYDPNLPNVSDRLLPPLSTGHNGQSYYLLGTDQLGRDNLSRVMAGGQVSVLIAFLAVLLSVVMGAVLGVMCGYFGKTLDNIVGMFVEIQHSIPMLLIIVMVLTLFGSSTVVLAVGLSLSEWLSIFRQTRAKTLVERKKDYTLAARVMGAGDGWIVFRHLIPNVMASIIVYGTLLIGTTILAEAGLSFLGLGVQRPYATWGRMISDGQTYMATGWWVSVFPALAVALLVIGVNFLGDGLRAKLKME